MKIRMDDYQEILEYLIKERWEGQEFVAYPFGGHVLGKENLFTFSSNYDAKEFCFENSTDIDYYNYLAIRSAYRAMSEAIKDNTLLIEKNGIVDIEQMVSRWYERLENEQFNNHKNKVKMNQKNFEYLHDQLKRTGFGEGLEKELKQNMEKGVPDFVLKHEVQYGKDKVTAELNFSQSKESEMYFFNTYQLSVQKESNAEAMKQFFYINKSGNITLKEAYNLMEGRSVNKNLTSKAGQKYNAWIQMDFKQSDDYGNFKLKYYHQNYGYDLETVLSKYPIRELGNKDYKSNLMDSLKRGNLQSTTFQINGTDQKQYIEANPQFKTINIYDGNLQRLDTRESKKEGHSQNEGQSTNQEQKKEKQAIDDDTTEIPKASRKRKKKQVIS